MGFMRIFSGGNGGFGQRMSQDRASKVDTSVDDFEPPYWIHSEDLSEDVQSIQSDAASDISPLDIVGTFGLLDDEKWKIKEDSSNDIRAMNKARDTATNGKHPYAFKLDIGTERTQSQLFKVLDRILSNLSEETDSMKAEDAQNVHFDHMNQPHRSMSSEEVPDRQVDEFVPFGDVRILALGLVGHGHASIPANIVKNSLEWHLHFVVASGQLRMEVHKHNESNDETTEKAAQVVRRLILERKYEAVIAFYRGFQSSKDQGPHSVTANTMIILAVTNALAGNKRASLKAAKRSLKMSREDSNKEESSLSLVLLGLVYLRFDDREKAMNTWREALQIVISIFGYDHPYTAKLLNNLGCLHYLQADFATCLQLFSESMDLNRKVLRSSTTGADALLLDISLSKGNVAMVLARSGKIEAACGLLDEVLSLQESITADGSEILSEVTRTAIDRLSDRIDNTSAISVGASSNFFGSKSALSELVADQTLDTFQCIQMEESKVSVFGNDDGIPMRRSGNKSPIHAIDASDYLDAILLGSLVRPYTPKQRVRAAILRWFNKTLQEDGDYQLPFVPYHGAFRKRTRIPIDLDTSEAIDAELYLHEITEQALDHLEHDEIEEALDLFQSSLYSHREKYGAVHHLVGLAFHNIGMVHLYAQEYSKALTCFQDAVSVRRSALGSDHPDVATSLAKIGMIYLLQRDPEGAKESFERAMKVVKKSMGYNSMQMARILNNIGVAQYDTGADSEALQSFCEAREIQERLLHIAKSEGGVLKIQTKTLELALANSLCNIGFLHCRQSNYIESYKVLQEAKGLLKIYGGVVNQDVYSLDENIQYVRGHVQLLEARESETGKIAMGSFTETLFGTMKWAQMKWSHNKLP